MKGTYCLILELDEDTNIRVGALGRHEFTAGVYAYVGSAISGVEQRVARHVRRQKTKRWHIDYLLSKAKVLSTVVVPSDTKDTECAVAHALESCGDARTVVKGFGSSDCGCGAHLFFFGAEDPAWVTELVTRTVAMLSCIYPSLACAGRE